MVGGARCLMRDAKCEMCDARCVIGYKVKGCSCLIGELFRRSQARWVRGKLLGFRL